MARPHNSVCPLSLKVGGQAGSGRYLELQAQLGGSGMRFLQVLPHQGMQVLGA